MTTDNEAVRKKEYPKLSLDQEPVKFEGPYCKVEFYASAYHRPYDPKSPFRITLWNDGFEASRSLSLDEIEAIRDWANSIIEMEKPHD